MGVCGISPSTVLGSLAMMKNIKDHEMRTKKRETPSKFTVTWVEQWKFWDTKWLNL